MQSNIKLYFRGTPQPKVFPIRESNGGNIQPQGEAQGKRERVRGNIASTPAQRDYKGGNNLIQLNQPTHSNDRVYGTDGVSPTLNTMQGGNRQPFIADNPQIRRLTPLECQRLQGFPDNFYDGIVLSDTQKYKQMGNAVSVPVVEAIVSRLPLPVLKYMQTTKKYQFQHGKSAKQSVKK